MKMVHQSIRVYARIRKDLNEKFEPYDILKKKKDYEDLVFLKNFNVSTIHQGFRFHKVFNTNTCQPEIFDIVAKPVICSVIEGFNGTVFAYGQTGSGKTYSINGSSKNYSDRGIIPRSIQFIFDHYSNIPEKPTIYISYMEIYNEIGYDLLSTKQQSVAKTLEELPRVFLLEDAKGDAHIRNLSVFPVTTEEEAMRLLFMGDTNRTIAETPYNEYSSRSHCIFTLYITHRSGSSKNLRSSKLHLVDLAGSERVCKNNTSGVGLHEAKFINLSLHFLQQVILALSESKRSHIPYRNSMLTHLLKDSLNGNCITTMLATLSLSKDNVQETISTCRFAQRVSLIETDPIINEITDPQQEIDLLKFRISELESELSRTSGFTSTENLTAEQKETCQFEVKSFINSEKKPLIIEPDMTQIQFCFNLLKNELKTKQKSLKELEALVNQKNTEIKVLNTEVGKKNEEIDKLKNIIDKIPENPVPLNSPTQCRATSVQSLYYKSRDGNLMINQEDQDSFEKFLSHPEISENLNFYKTALENKLNMAKIYAETIEQCKRKITIIRNKLDDPTSVEKQDLIRELEEQQKLYKKVLLEMKHIQNETNHLEAGLKQAEIRAVYKFKTWFEEPLNRKNNLEDKVERPLEKGDYSSHSSDSSSLYNKQKHVSKVTNRKMLQYNASVQDNQLIDHVKSENIVSPKRNSHISPSLSYCLQQPSNTTIEQKPSSIESDILSVSQEYLDIKHQSSPDSTHFLHYCKNFESTSTIQNSPTTRKENYNSDDFKRNYKSKLKAQVDIQNRNKKTLSNHDKICDFNLYSNMFNSDNSLKTLTPDEEFLTSKEPSDPNLKFEDCIPEVDLDDDENDNKFGSYFTDQDTIEFREFMKTVTLSGVPEIDEEIVSFYRSKLC